MTPTTVAPQLTVRAIVLAIILAMILAAANTYLGLFAGLTIASAIPAAVVSMAVLRLLGGGGILENNIVQTGASAGSSIASGVIFTVPALVILGHWADFDYLWVLAIAGLGGILGVFFSVPLRRALIVEQKLAFPEGKAAAEVLKTGENPGAGVKILALAAIGGGLAKLAAGSGLRLIPDTAAAAGWVGKGIAYFGTNLSPALLAVGYIVGLNIGILVVLGGIISWNIAIPIYSTYFLEGNTALATALAGASAEDAAGAIWSAQIRYLGVGAMLVGGVWALISIRSSLLSGVKSGLAAARAGVGTVIAHTEQDLPMKAILIGILLFTLPLFVLYQNIVGNLGVSLPMTIIMIVAGFLFCSVSAYMAGLVGSSNNPVSGITICTILFAAIVLILLMGRDAAARSRGRDHDRRGGLLRRLHRWRQPAGPEVRLHRRRHTLEAAGHARDRRRLERARDGAGAQSAAQGLWHRCPDRRAPRPAARATGDADGLGREGHVRRRAALEHGGDRRSDRRGHHRLGPVAQATRRDIPCAGSCGCRRHLPASRALGADFCRRADRAPRRAQAWRLGRCGRR